MGEDMVERFTPGPWKIYRANNGSVLGIGDAEAGGVTDYQGGFWRDGKEKRANIHLVAAAPTVFAALKYARNLIGPDEIIDAAITAALGGEGR